MLQIAVITAAVLLFITSIAVRWRKNSNSNSVHIKRLHDSAQLPKGSWSLPWIGESLSLYSQGPSQFCSQRIARYGRTFRTHLMGYPTIVTSTVEAAKFALVTRQKSFALFHPLPIINLLSAPPATVSQEMQAKLIKTIRDTTHSQSLRNRIANIDRITRWTLSSWDKQPCVVTYQETKKLTFHIILDFIAGMAPSPETMKMMDDFNYIIKGMGTFMQFNIPGTSYHMALKKKQKLLEAFSAIVKKRRLEKSKDKCFIDTLMEIESDNGEKMPDYALPFQLCGVMFAGFHTSTIFFVWLVKFLEENQQILQEVKAEQEAIRMGKSSPEDPLSWTDVMIHMPLTLAVIQETLRLVNLAPFLIRQATEDINYEGIRIPRRWLFQFDMENIHLNPKYHKDPLKFDPSRFQAPTKPNAFLPFGDGDGMCPGRDLAKFEACVFLHYLVTTYSWESIGSENGVDYWPIRTVKGGLPIKVSKLRKCVT